MRVIIPSKGRPTTKAYKLLGDIPFTHLVEPQDEAAYKAANVPNLQVIPANDQGIAFVRNYLIHYAQIQGFDWVWAMDDDVQGFGIAKAGKTIKGDHTVLSSFYADVSQYKFPVNGINYCQHAWSYSTGKTRFMVNRKTAEVCTLLYIPKITWSYRGRLNLKEDRDFCMQSIVTPLASFLIRIAGSIALALARTLAACKTNTSKTVIEKQPPSLLMNGSLTPSS